MADSIRLEMRGSAAVVTMTREKVRNALRAEDARALSETIDEAAANPDCLGIVLTGGASFSSGGHLGAILAMVEGRSAEEVSTAVYRDFQAMARSLRDCAVPTIAAVDGPAIGLGLDLALWCDMRYLGPTARLGQGWAALGLIPGTGGAALLQQLRPGAIWSLMGERPMTANDAAVLGLGTAVENTMAAALERIEGWTAIGRAALEGYARLTRGTLPDDEALRQCALVQGQLLTSERFRATAEKLLGGVGQKPSAPFAAPDPRRTVLAPLSGGTAH
ncbi:enoyl-CoA hydratase/isomerase family protein [Arthrobacter sp. W4I7]|uniref:enoyl-CoA hydratase/isomerase family protein n=1 Tax=Arthrobacter sp. W4I7 TaxID=3042296 RepID=UPI0027846595|nr:enoyl-CoA hydratase/isomerase family protein [Arthrobacter sp. W4I7]MDQ0691386.1 enoyl-CoA hydratase [Arthrobacter sp. W4I7]